MNKNKFKRILTLFVILFFIGLSFSPALSNISANKKIQEDTETITFNKEFRKVSRKGYGSRKANKVYP